MGLHVLTHGSRLVCGTWIHIAEMEEDKLQPNGLPRTDEMTLSTPEGFLIVKKVQAAINILKAGLAEQRQVCSGH